MKQIMFEKLTMDEQEKVRAGEESLPTPDTSSCYPGAVRPTEGCAP